MLSSFMATAANAEVHNLTMDNFQEFVKENDNVIVKFFAPWCGHCKKMAPDYIEASDKVDEEGKFKFAEVDVTEQSELGSMYDIKGFPTIKVFTKGVASDYEGGRTKTDFLNYVDMMTSDPVTKVESIEEAKKDDAAVIYVATSKAGTDSYAKFEKLAIENRMMGKFFHVEGETEEILVVRKDGEASIKIAEENLLSLLKAEKLSLFGRVSGENYGDYMATGLPMVWFAGSQKDMEAVKTEVEASATAHRGVYNFIWMDSTEFARQIEGMLGVEASALPLMVRTLEGPGKYVLEGDVSADNIAKWMKDQEEGKLSPVLKSEEIPETNDEPVTILVGKNFDSVVQEDKDVLMMIHAPWCGHCKKFMPDFEAAAAVVREKSPDTVVAVMDGTANELENADYSFRSFPTVYFKPAGSNKPRPYTGERDTNGVLTFLSENVKTKFEFSAVKTTDDEL